MTHRTTLSKLAWLVSAILAANAQAQEPVQVETEQAGSIERISISSSRIKRIDLEGSANIVSLSSEDMIKSGVNSVYDALSNLSSATGAVLGEVETGSYTPGAKELNLRGLGPEYTLVLVNGKRLANYPIPFGGQSNFVNVDVIPTGMVEKIDIQTGGASAIYGSDAMAGVVNVVTKKNIQGHYLDLEGGIDTYGSNRQKDINLFGGFQGERWSLDYSLQYTANDGLFSGDRPYHDSIWDNPSPTANRELNRSITVYSEQTEFLNNYAEAYCNTSDNRHPKAVLHYIKRNNYGPSCGWDETGEMHLINKNEKLTTYLNASYQLNDDTSLSLTGFYVDQEKKGNRGSLFFSDTQFWDPDLIDKDGNQGAAIKYMWRKVLDSEYTDDNFGRTYNDDVYSLTLSLDGSLGDYYYSIGAARSVYNFKDRYLHNTVEGLQSVLGPKLGEVNGLPVHRPDYKLWFGVMNPEQVFAIADWATYDGKSQNNTINASIGGDLFDLPAGPVSFSLYAEYLNESTAAIPDQRILNKEFAGLTGLITEGERDRYGISGEVLVPITDTLDVEGALRYDYYDDDSNVGGAVTSQLGVLYRPVESVIFRTAAATTFRGPDMAAVYKGFAGNFGQGNDRMLADACVSLSNNGNAAGYDSDALALSCKQLDTSNPDINALPASFESLSRGDKTLKEETGSTLTAGLVYQFNDHLSFNLDYYDIQIENKVTTLGAGYIIALDYDCSTGKEDANSALCADMKSRIGRYDASGKGTDYLGNSITGDPYAIHTVTEGYINAAERQDAGVDVGFKGEYATDDWGTFKYNGNLTRVTKKKTKLKVEDELQDKLDDQDNYDFKTLANANLTWEYQGTALSLQANYRGELWNNAAYGKRQKLPAWTTYNLTLGHQFNDDNRLIFTISNLLNAMPPQDETFDRFPFYNAGAYNSLGRQFRVRYTMSF
ncbi:TonB-dependent receptor [Bowmanella sp. Y26]|uniref:TonB-dependent receptor domain-containing protein n=1 Tax=Bowmanella yangjiangensis TaxID=2811230 RepID=UPI001BDD749F|nr:TonB-dependent receptor [Bowmanella yangjiangensis]MBT1064698.1 TonB-dependent receptor [Bowmanella yangjiangensis]